MSAPLRTHGVQVHFAGVKALDGVDLQLESGEILGLIGPNGAGKTTFVNVVSGFQPPTSGDVWLGESNSSRWSPERVSKAGLARTFQNVRLFPELSVFDNLLAGALAHGHSHKAAAARAWTLLDRMSLQHRAQDPAGSLSHGEGRWLGLMRALATGPSVLVADEPAAGLNELESDELVDLLRSARDELGVSTLVIEHNMRFIMRLCDRIQVLDHGRTIAVGAPDEIRTDEQVLEAYLGAEA